MAHVGPHVGRGRHEIHGEDSRDARQQERDDHHPRVAPREVLLLEERGRCQARALEADLRRLALLHRFGRLQELRCRKAEHAGEDAIREGLEARVVFHHRVVIGLARERHLVFGAGELFLQAEHVLIRLQVGILLEDRQEPPERAAERAFGLREALHRRRIAWLRRRRLRGAHRVAARLDHRLERAALVLHVALDRLDEIRNQVVATLQLHIDLRERVLETVTQRHQAVEDADRPDRERDDHREENPQSHGLPPYVLVPAATIARRPSAPPSAVESTRPTADIAMAHTASARACIPTARRPVTSQPPTASAPRTATMSITFFALYFSSRASTVKSTSRAGFEMAKLAVRCSAWKAITTASTGVAASTAKPPTKTTGTSASAGPMPKRWMSLPATRDATLSARTPTASPTTAKM